MTRKMERHPIWEASSQKPLYPKSVWVAGYRHFILDHDIKKRRNKSQNVAARKAISCDVIEEDMESLKLNCMLDIQNERGLSNESGEIDVRNCRRFMKQNRNNFDLIKDQLNYRITSKECQKKPSDCDVQTKDTSEDHVEIEYRRNQLTERVLNWLDLAGRNTMVKPENEVSLKNVSKRRVYTTESIKKPSQNFATIPQVIRRSDSIHHLSLTFNEDDTYLAQTSHNGADERERSNNFGDVFHTTYNCSRKFLTGLQRSVQPKVLSTSPNKTEKYAEPEKRKRNGHKTRKDEYKGIESQYRAMIQRQILENSCNTQFAKRQLHIFMPNLPKKKFMLPNNFDDSDSMLSTAMSSQFSNLQQQLGADSNIFK